MARPEFYQGFTDHLGNILEVYDSNGQAVFEASYDAWGRQTVTKNNIGLRYGYTGHEMLPEFGLIDMKGRVYDPALGRFLSPDNYVQEPTNSQSFNRYSYCVNNPLKYTDPSGELFGIDDAIFIFAAFNMANSMMQAATNGKNIWKAAGISLLSSAATYGIGSLFGGVGSLGKEALRAGAHGLSSGVTTALSGGNFLNGFASGALSSGIGSFAQGIKMPNGAMVGCTTAMGGLASWATGGDFWQGAMNGLVVGALNHSMHKGEKVRVLKDGTLEAIKPLPEVEIIGHYRLHEKGLECVYPEFAVFTMFKALANNVAKVALNASGRIVNNLYNEFNSYSKQTIRDYDKRLFHQSDSYHNFPYSYDKVIIQEGERLPSTSNGTLYRLKGTLNGKEGYYGIKINKNGKVFHREFIPLKKADKMY